MSANNSHVIERSSFLNGANKRKAGDKGDKLQQALLLQTKVDQGG
jgi:hypothetical protein